MTISGRKECLTIAYIVMMPYTALYQYEFRGKYDQRHFPPKGYSNKTQFMLNKYNYKSIDYKVSYNTCFTTLSINNL